MLLFSLANIFLFLLTFFTLVCFCALPYSLFALGGFWVLMPWAQLCNVPCRACCSLHDVLLLLELCRALKVNSLRRGDPQPFWDKYCGHANVTCAHCHFLHALSFNVLFSLVPSHVFIPWGYVLFRAFCTSVKQLQLCVSATFT